MVIIWIRRRSSIGQSGALIKLRLQVRFLSSAHMTSMETLGLLSAALALSAFVANEYHKLSSDSVWYDLLNFLSGCGLVIYALSINALPFVLAHGVWAFVSGMDLFKYARKRFNTY
jgi:hypothetical protein